MASCKVFRAFLFFFLLTAVSLPAQDAYVRGTVTDSASGEALIGVVIRAGSGGGTVSDVNGGYLLAAKPGPQTVSFEYSGYAKQDVQLDLESGKTLQLDVKLVNTSKQLNVVVISSGRYEQNIGEVPVSIEVLKPRLIENKNISNVETIMDQVPGVTMTDGQANIRGGSGFSYGAGSRVLLVVDEMPMLSGDANDVKWNYLPIENVSQVEVMKGASSALFGSSALNGVIHFRTAYPTDKPATTITMHTGFYDEPKRPELRWWRNANPTYSGFNVAHSRQLGNWDLVFGGHLFNDDGYRYLETEQRQRFNMNTRYRFKKIPGLNAGVNTNMMRTTGGLFLLWYNDSLAYIPADSTLQNYKNYRFNVDPFVNYIGANGHRHALRTRYFRTDNNNDLNQGSTADFYYGEYQYQYKFKNAVTVTAGVVGSYTNVESDLYMNHTGANTSAYAQFDKKFFSRLFVTVGVRGEYFRVDTAATEYSMVLGKDTLTLPFRPVMRAGVNYQVSEATYLRISYGQGYRFPCIAEKFVRTDASGLQIYPNPGLQPEYGQSAEIGIKQGVRVGQWKGYADLAIFWMQYENMMEFAFGAYGTPSDPLFGFGFRSVNIGTTRTRGIDVSIMGQGKIGQLDVSLLAGYTYMDPVSLRWNPAEDTLVNTSHENILKYRYRHIAKFDGEVSYKKFTFGASMRYNSFMENIDKIFEQAVAVLPGIKSYRERFNQGDLVFDTRMMYQVTERARVSLITNNVFNRENSSRPADVQAPRNFALQVMVKF
jgi:outer membrane receptor protein involved in Fe transport